MDCVEHQELELGLPVYGRDPRPGASLTRSEAGSYKDDQEDTSDEPDGEKPLQDGTGEVDIQELPDDLLLAAAEGASFGQPTAVVIGASLVKHLDMAADAVVVAKSGTKAGEIQELLHQAASVVDADQTEKVILHLGTNDLMHSKNDSEVVKLNIAEAISKVKDVFQQAAVGVAAIPPRKGKSPGILHYNQNAKTVNHYMQMLAERDDRVSYLDTYKAFAPNAGHVTKSLYSDRDPTGVHFSDAGVNTLKQEFLKFLKMDNEDTRKRMRSAESTPNSVEKSTKKGKQTDQEEPK